MKQTKVIMGMPITVEIVGKVSVEDVAEVFNYFRQVDKRYSPYRPASEVCKLNRGVEADKLSSELRYVLELCEATKRVTGGYFDATYRDSVDPSGLVKGWAVQNAANMLCLGGYQNFYVEAGGDVAVSGGSDGQSSWTIGIRNPFASEQIVKTLAVTARGVATSGTYIRGQHIYNPLDKYRKPVGVQSLTVIGPNVYEADRFATAAFAMGREGIAFIEQLAGFEGYMIDDSQLATYTSGFEDYVVTLT